MRLKRIILNRIKKVDDWVSYEVFRAEPIKYVARYEHPIKGWVASISIMKDNGVIFYKAYVKQGTRLVPAGESTNDISEIERILKDFSENKLEYNGRRVKNKYYQGLPAPLPSLGEMGIL